MRRRLPLVVALSLVAAGCSGGATPVAPLAVAPVAAIAVAEALATAPELGRPDFPVVTADLAALWALDSTARIRADQSGITEPSTLTIAGDDDAVARHGDAGVVLATGGSIIAELSEPARQSIVDGFTMELWFETASPADTFVTIADGGANPVGTLAILPGEDGDCENELGFTMIDVVALTGCFPSGALVHALVAVTPTASWLFVDGIEAGTGPGRPVDDIASIVIGGDWSGLVSSLSVLARPVVGDEAVLHNEAGPRGLVGDGPEFLRIADVTASPGDAVEVAIEAFDWSGDAVTIRVDTSALPGATASVEGDSTVVRWTPTGSDVGTHVVTVEASDGQRRAGSSFVVTVVHAAGIPALLAGTGVLSTDGNGGSATLAGLNNPGFVTVGADGSIYIADYDASLIRRVDPDGVISTVAGAGISGFTGDGIPASQTLMANPTGLVFGPDGSLYYSDHNNHTVRLIRPDGLVVSVAGNGLAGYSGDRGPALEASLWSPEDLAIDSSGALFITDQDNHVVRRVGPDGVITTVAGTGQAGGGIEGLPAVDSPLFSPSGIAIRSDGTIIFSDERDHVVWSVADDGVLRRVAGTGEPGFSGDGGTATGAKLARPTGLELSPGGLLYIADTDNKVIRVVDQKGSIWTLVNDQPAVDGGATPLNGIPVRDLAWDSVRSRMIAASPTTGRIWAIDDLE